MYDLLFALLIAGGFSLALALAYLLFCLALYIVNKLSGGRFDLISFLEKL
jgi:hypothetical protein